MASNNFFLQSEKMMWRRDEVQNGPNLDAIWTFLILDVLYALPAKPPSQLPVHCVENQNPF